MKCTSFQNSIQDLYPLFPSLISIPNLRSKTPPKTNILDLFTWSRSLVSISDFLHDICPDLLSWSPSLTWVPDLRSWPASRISVPDLHWWSPSQGSVTDFRPGALKGNIFAATGDTRYRVKCWQTIYYTSPSVAANFWGKIHQFTSDWPYLHCHAERSEASLTKGSILRITPLLNAQEEN